ncbi:hypothetical protein [Marinivivus vitaminiproducens]|uniref:hypothetical protein n=1 Tax=Marinivivus vitaminiproducens TaxID=3035935 RepID=UPI0027AB5C97|nr:hypothetical protein P4R82_13020 [Geminicoccaceae bacterium SCSIO 64248]
MAFLHDAAAWLHATPLAAAVRTSFWLYPAINVAHVLGVGLAFGLIAAADLRLLGRTPELPVAGLLRHVLPIVWAAFALAVLSGLLLFIADATDLVGNPVLGLKLAVLALVGVNVLVFHVLARGDAGHPLARASALASLLLWSGAIGLGRWIAYY